MIKLETLTDDPHTGVETILASLRKQINSKPGLTTEQKEELFCVEAKLLMTDLFLIYFSRLEERGLYELVWIA